MGRKPKMTDHQKREAIRHGTFSRLEETGESASTSMLEVGGLIDPLPVARKPRGRRVIPAAFARNPLFQK
jgi:hypothetical protein